MRLPRTGLQQQLRSCRSRGGALPMCSVRGDCRAAADARPFPGRFRHRARPRGPKANLGWGTGSCVVPQPAGIRQVPLSDNLVGDVVALFPDAIAKVLRQRHYQRKPLQQPVSVLHAQLRPVIKGLAADRYERTSDNTSQTNPCIHCVSVSPIGTHDATSKASTERLVASSRRSDMTAAAIRCVRSAKLPMHKHTAWRPACSAVAGIANGLIALDNRAPSRRSGRPRSQASTDDRADVDDPCS